MAEIKKIVIKQSPSQVYRYDRYKIAPIFLDNNIVSSFSAIDLSLVSSNSDIFGLGISNEIIDLTKKDYLSEIGTINTLRNEGGIVPSTKEPILYNSIATENSVLVEEIPDNLHTSEYLRNLKNINFVSEFSRKQSMLKRMARIYGETSEEVPYATNLWMLPLGITGEISIIPVNGRIDSSEVLISGYIKILSTTQNTNLNLVMRGVPVPMRRVLTSINHDPTITYNYVFIYPQYLIDNIELIQAIDYIEINNYTVGSSIYYSNNYYFEIEDAEGYGENLAPLHILNKELRNIDILEE
jgi:hypothetical protein